MTNKIFNLRFVIAAVLMTAMTMTAAAEALSKQTTMEHVTLSNGVQMPVLGYGTLRLPKEDCANAVADAIRRGWRLIDTAKNYQNETEVGEGIRMSGVDRTELFVTSKIWIKDYGYEETKRAFQQSLDRLGLDYLDLCLLHQPFGDIYGAWRALEELYEAGKIRAIGVSNFFPDRLTDLCMTQRIRPMVNQIEFSPYFQRWQDVRENEALGVKVESWGPLVSGMHPEIFDEPALKKIAAAHNKSVAQVILRWLTQQGVIVVCKTGNRERMTENISVFDFVLTDDEIGQIGALDKGHTMSKDHRLAKDVEWFWTQATR